MLYYVCMYMVSYFVRDCETGAPCSHGSGTTISTPFVDLTPHIIFTTSSTTTSAPAQNSPETVSRLSDVRQRDGCRFRRFARTLWRINILAISSAATPSSMHILLERNDLLRYIVIATLIHAIVGSGSDGGHGRRAYWANSHERCQ